MGLLALIFSLVLDALRPLRGGPQEAWSEEEASVMGHEEGVGDPLAEEAPYDPLADSPEADAQPRAAPLAAKSGAGYVSHPLERHALRLIDWIAGHGAGGSAGERDLERADALPVDASGLAVPGGPRRLSLAGWLAAVGLPVVLVALAQAVLESIGGFFVFLLHVVVLYLCVGLAAFHRRFSELQLLIGAGEERSARLVLARWMPAGSGGGAASAARAEAGFDDGESLDAGASSTALGGTRTAGAGMAARAGDSAMPLAGQATAQVVLSAYREVFAPLFWYMVLPGAIGPVLYLFARFAACHTYPFARTAYRWLDWIPLRLASLGFALVGQFEDTVFCLRSVSGIATDAGACADPYLHQRLLLLPVSGGALGFRLTDSGVDAQLRVHAPELDLPGLEREASSLRPVSGLLMRSAVVWVGIYLLVSLLA